MLNNYAIAAFSSVIKKFCTKGKKENQFYIQLYKHVVLWCWADLPDCKPVY